MDYVDIDKPQRLAFKMGGLTVRPKNAHGGDPLSYSSFRGGHQKPTGQDLAKGSPYPERLRKLRREYLKNNPGWLAARRKIKVAKEEKRLKEEAMQHERMVQIQRDNQTSEQRRHQGLQCSSSSSSPPDEELDSVDEQREKLMYRSDLKPVFPVKPKRRIKATPEHEEAWSDGPEKKKRKATRSTPRSKKQKQGAAEETEED